MEGLLSTGPTPSSFYRGMGKYLPAQELSSYWLLNGGKLQAGGCGVWIGKISG